MIYYYGHDHKQWFSHHFPLKVRWIPRGNVEMSPPVTVIMTMTAENDQGYIVEKDEEDRIP